MSALWTHIKFLYKSNWTTSGEDIAQQNKPEKRLKVLRLCFIQRIFPLVLEAMMSFFLLRLSTVAYICLSKLLFTEDVIEF